MTPSSVLHAGWPGYDIPAGDCCSVGTPVTLSLVLIGEVGKLNSKLLNSDGAAAGQARCRCRSGSAGCRPGTEDMLALGLI